MKTKLLISVTFLYVLTFHACFSANASDFKIPDMDDPKEFLYRKLSADAYFSLPCHEDNVTASRRYLGPANVAYYVKPNELNFEVENSEPALSYPMRVVDTDRYNTVQANKNSDTLDPDAKTILHLCYAISYIWRRGRKSIHRYYGLRDTYVVHMPFEIGYLTQMIMAKYQNVLELYELSTKMEGPENKIGRPHLYFFYKNILEDCQLIIHLCNMIHEVTRKYRTVLKVQRGFWKWEDVKYDPSHKFDEKTGNQHNTGGVSRNYEIGIEGFEHEKYLATSRPMYDAKKAAEEEKQRLYKIHKPNREHFLDHGYFTMTNTPASRRTRRWQPKDPLEYGWDDAQNK